MPASHAAALRHLRRADPTLARVIATAGPCTLVARAEGTHFQALLRSIVYQQLSGKAAGTIHARVLALFPRRAPSPERLLALEDEPLRAAGLSRQKIAYARSLAEHVVSGALPLTRVARLEDDALIEALTAVKGIGRWTAQMFLMFRLGRPDVFPELDLGVQKGIQRAYALPRLPTPKEAAAIGAWYMWRVIDGDGTL